MATYQDDKPSNVGGTPPQPNAQSPDAQQTGNRQVASFTNLGGNVASLMQGNSGRLSNLLAEFRKLKSSNPVVERYEAYIMTNPNLPGGEVLLFVIPVANEVYVSSVFNGDADWDRGYEIAGQSMGRMPEFGSVKTTPAEVVNRVLYRKGPTGDNEPYMPYREDLFKFLKSTAPGLLAANATSKNVISTFTHAVRRGQEVDVARLLGFADFDTRAVVFAVNNLIDEEADSLLSSMGNKVSVSMSSHSQTIDGLGTPVFAPIVVQVSRQGNNAYRNVGAGGNVERVGEIYGYLDVIPMDAQSSHQLRVQRANERNLPIDQVQVPAVKPIFVVTGMEWLANKPYPTPEAMLFMLDALTTMGENPQWLRKVIDAPTIGSASSDYDIGAIGYLGNGEKTTIYQSGDLSDDGRLMQHILEFWDTISVAIDIPKSGPYRTALELLTEMTHVNRLLRNIYGEHAVQLDKPPIIASMQKIPIGIYRDAKNVWRDSRDATNLITWMNRMGGTHESIQGWLNDWVAQIGSPDEIYAKRYNLISTLIANESFELTNEVTRVVINTQLLHVLHQNNGIKGVEVSGRSVTPAANTDFGFKPGSFGDGISYQQQAGPGQNQAFQNLPKYY